MTSGDIEAFRSSLWVPSIKAIGNSALVLPSFLGATATGTTQDTLLSPHSVAAGFSLDFLTTSLFFHSEKTWNDSCFKEKGYH